jgi:hypothetical protein
MPAHDQDSRVLAARIAAAERWGRSGSAEDRAKATAPARRGLWAKFLREADPDGVLSDAEREARAHQLQHAHMLRMTAAAKAGHRRRRIVKLRTQLTELEGDGEVVAS